MTRLSLRLRIFLFFATIGIGAVGVVALAVFAGYRQHGDTEALSAFITTGAISGFGILAIATGIWLLFDENVAKPVERLAAELRARTHGGVTRDIDADACRYLGDLAPAALALNRKLGDATLLAAEEVANRTAQLAAEKHRLTTILTDIPLAVMMVNPAHQIVLYDGQSAELLEKEGHARLNASVFDYFNEVNIRMALAEVRTTGQRRVPVVAETHSGLLYSGHLRLLGEDAGYMLMLEPLTPDAERPLTYDFELIGTEVTSDQREARLKRLTYVVFDSETTGLDPMRDDVVQIGAVRVVNGRIVEGERFDILVNPGRPIPASSTKVHGISDDMVANSPGLDKATRAFHAFARDAVLVAHNAPFDLAFLKRYGAQLGLKFDHPVLDTVLLSAVLFGQSEIHTLDALSERLGVDISAAHRHTAIGDAVATAQVFVACLSMLEGRGFDTFGSVLSEVRKHGRLIEDMNRD